VVLAAAALNSTDLATERLQNLVAVQISPRISSGPLIWRGNINNTNHRRGAKLPLERQRIAADLGLDAACSSALLNIDTIGKVHRDTHRAQQFLKYQRLSSEFC
jgi:hypothetical protein